MPVSPRRLSRRLSALLDPAALTLDVAPLRENRQFRVLFTARLISLAGLGMLMVAFSWQVYQLTNSSVQVALVNSTLGISAFVGALSGGVLADRYDRRRVIILARAGAVLGFVVLAVNAMLPEPALAVLYVVAVWDGVVGGVSSTALAAAVPAVLEPRHLPSSGALMAITLDLGAVVAPVLAGLLTAAGGVGLVYVVVVATSTASLAVLFRLGPVHPGRPETPGEPQSWRANLMDGLRYGCTDRVVGGVLALGLVQLLLASPYVLVPQFVTEHLGGGTMAVGVIFAAPAAGALIATVVSGWIDRVHRAGRLLGVLFVLACLGVAAFGAAPTLAVAVAAMAVVGALDVLAEIARFTIVSERTPDRLRGRVAGLWSAQGMVGDSLGGPVLSLLARPLGPGGAIVVGGLLGAVATVVLVAGLRPLRSVTRSPGQAHPPHRPEPRPTATFDGST